MKAKDLIQELARYDPEDEIIFEVRAENRLPEVYTDGAKTYASIAVSKRHYASVGMIIN